MTEEQILLALKQDDQFVRDMVIAMHKRQAPIEQLKKETIYLNMRGFSQADAKRGTSWAQHLLKGKPLTYYHLKNCRKMLMKYVRQISEIVAREERFRRAIEVAQAKCLSGLHEKYGPPCDRHEAFCCPICTPEMKFP